MNTVTLSPARIGRDFVGWYEHWGYLAMVRFRSFQIALQLGAGLAEAASVFCSLPPVIAAILVRRRLHLIQVPPHDLFGSASNSQTPLIALSGSMHEPLPRRF